LIPDLGPTTKRKIVEEKEKCKRDYASVFFASICAFSGSLVFKDLLNNMPKVVANILPFA
jgi:uncharacterized membrane protein YgdD (TMEM256/DUF423 family)